MQKIFNIGGGGAALSSISDILDLPTDSPIEVKGVNLIKCDKMLNLRIETITNEKMVAGSYKTVGTLKPQFRPHHTLVYACFSGTVALGALIQSNGKISVKAITGDLNPTPLNMTLQFIAQ